MLCRAPQYVRPRRSESNHGGSAECLRRGYPGCCTSSQRCTLLSCLTALRQLQPFVQLLVAFMELCAADPESSPDITSAMIGVIGYVQER
jgi:hypothetical protein